MFGFMGSSEWDGSVSLTKDNGNVLYALVANLDGKALVFSRADCVFLIGDEGRELSGSALHDFLKDTFEGKEPDEAFKALTYAVGSDIDPYADDDEVSTQSARYIFYRGEVTSAGRNILGSEETIKRFEELWDEFKGVYGKQLSEYIDFEDRNPVDDDDEYDDEELDYDLEDEDY